MLRESVNMLQGTIFDGVDEIPFKEIENHGDGNCLYESVLDSAYHWLPSHHILNTYNTGRRSTQRNLLDQKSLRSQLVQFVRAIDDPYMLRSLKKLSKNKNWGTDREIQVIANCFDICIVLHSESDRTWTVIVPNNSPVDSCKHGIIIRNKGSYRKGRSHGTSGIHYVALVPKTTKKSKLSQASSKTKKKLSHNKQNNLQKKGSITKNKYKHLGRGKKRK